LREARVEGKVMLLIAVKSNGSVGEVKVQSGNPALAQAAVEAVKRWKFEPAIYDGRPIAVWLPYPFVFRLDGK
jgi:protein TonB